GKVSLGDVAWLEIMGSLPTSDQSVLFNAMMVTMVEHGMTPNAIAARMTYLGAPESLNGAVAAGLCGLGTVFAGTAEGAARLLQEALAGAGSEPDLPGLAARIVTDARAKKAQIPGLGHPLHKPIDPRTPRLFALAREQGRFGNHCRLMELVAAEAERVSGKSLPVNATGAIGAIASELGIDWRLCRGIAVMGRAVVENIVARRRCRLRIVRRHRAVGSLGRRHADHWDGPPVARQASGTRSPGGIV
ncbi:MAG TPA: citryl-CoA lyase, partial [Polyangiaceae bacterium]